MISDALTTSKTNWSSFFKTKTKIITSMIILVLVTAIITVPFFSRFTFGLDGQFFSCMPGKWLFVVDAKDKVLERGNIYALNAYGIEGVFKEGQKLAKFLVGMPGDEIVANEQGVFVNGKNLATDYLAGKWLGFEPGQFYGKKTLSENEYWFMGVGKMSFDSRYYGAMPLERIIGRAYALL